MVYQSAEWTSDRWTRQRSLWYLRDVSDTAYVAVRRRAFHLPISGRNLDILCIHVDDTEIHTYRSSKAVRSNSDDPSASHIKLRSGGIKEAAVAFRGCGIRYT